MEIAKIASLHRTSILRHDLENRTIYPNPVKWDSLEDVVKEMEYCKSQNIYWPRTSNITNTTEVTLTPIEIEFSTYVGYLLALYGAFHGKFDKYPDPKQSKFDTYIQGMLGEQAYCKSRNLFWEMRMHSYKKADVGNKTQIKTNPYPDGDLIVRDEDIDDHFCVLVTGKMPTYTLRGWMLAETAKKLKQYYKKPNSMPNAYFIPQYLLKTDFPYNQKELS